MNSYQFKNRSLHINKFHSLTPSQANEFSYQQFQQVFNFNNVDQISERKQMPFNYPTYKPYSNQKRIHQYVVKNVQSSFNSLKINKPCSMSPLRKKTLTSFLFADSIQNKSSTSPNQQTQLRQFSLDLPQIQQIPKRREFTIFKKKKKAYSLKIQIT